jgi:GT2 family glycosyltransferase
LTNVSLLLRLEAFRVLLMTFEEFAKCPVSSIVIVNRNGGSILAQCIESVRRNTRDYEILLIDNASTDDSVGTVGPGSDLRAVKLSSNLGFAGANIVGIRKATGRYIVLLNPDTIVTPSWLEKLVDEAEKSPVIGLVQPKLLRPGSPPILDSTGHLFHYQTGLAADRGQGRPDKGQYDENTELPSCCFACTLIKREVFEDIGLPDPHLFTLLDDVDFGLRASLAGWRVVFRPDSIVYHLRGGSTKEPVRDRVNYLGRGAYQLHIVLKIYELKNALLVGGRIFIMFPLRVAAGIRKRDLAYAKGYVQSALWTLTHLPLRERLFYQRRKRVSDDMLMIANPRS